MCMCICVYMYICIYACMYMQYLTLEVPSGYNLGNTFSYNCSYFSLTEEKGKEKGNM